jgi:hypothetical protein
VGYDDAGPSPGEAFHGPHQERLREGVHSRCGLVQDEYFGIVKKGSQEGQKLSLPQGQILAPFIQHGLVTTRKPLDPFPYPHLPSHLFHILEATVSPPKGDIFEECSPEEEHIWGITATCILNASRGQL